MKRRKAKRLKGQAEKVYGSALTATRHARRYAASGRDHDHEFAPAPLGAQRACVGAINNRIVRRPGADAALVQSIGDQVEQLERLCDRPGSWRRLGSSELLQHLRQRISGAEQRASGHHTSTPAPSLTRFGRKSRDSRFGYRSDPS